MQTPWMCPNCSSWDFANRRETISGREHDCPECAFEFDDAKDVWVDPVFDRLATQEYELRAGPAPAVSAGQAPQQEGRKRRKRAGQRRHKETAGERDAAGRAAKSGSGTSRSPFARRVVIAIVGICVALCGATVKPIFDTFVVQAGSSSTQVIGQLGDSSSQVIEQFGSSSARFVETVGSRVTIATVYSVEAAAGSLIAVILLSFEALF